MSSNHDKTNFGTFIAGVVAIIFSVVILLTIIRNRPFGSAISVLINLLIIVVVIIPISIGGILLIHQYLSSKFKMKK